MDLGIKDRVALVCASSKGLGRACAEALAAEGVALFLNGRDAGSLNEAARAIAAQYGVSVTPVAADLGTPHGREIILRACPSPDILINNAGGPPPGGLKQWTEADWDRALATNLRAPAALIGAYIDGMAERGFGRIVNITSSIVRHPIDVQGLSAAARAGLHGLVATLVRGVASRNVTVNNILPGTFATQRLVSNFTFIGMRQGRTAEEALAARRGELSAKRFGEPAELGKLCAYLCSVHAAYISGQNILIDGGAHPQTF